MGPSSLLPFSRPLPDPTALPSRPGSLPLVVPVPSSVPPVGALEDLILESQSDVFVLGQGAEKFCV